MKSICWILCIFVTCFTISGCCCDMSSSSTEEQSLLTTPAMQFPKVLKDNTVYYDFPAQARPPNGTAQKGWKLRILKDAGSYTQVEFENGIKGYIPTDLIE